MLKTDIENLFSKRSLGVNSEYLKSPNLYQMNCAMHAQNVKKNIETFLLGTLRAVSVIDKSFPKCTPIVDLVLFQLLFFLRNGKSQNFRR